MDSLTAHSCRFMKVLCNLWIHFDHDVFLYGNFLVTGIDLCFYPIIELVFDNSRAHICNPLLWSLWKLNIGLREVIIDFGMVLVQEMSDFLNTKTFISRSKCQRVRIAQNENILALLTVEYG